MNSAIRSILWFFIITGYFYSVFSFAASRIPRGSSVRDGGETIISAGEKFELGFFSPQGSGFRYLGIWYYGIAVQTVVWVANRGRPISGNDGVLTVGDDGNLKITQRDGEIVWSSNATVTSSNSTAALMDTGNLVILATENSKRVLWQSFDLPTDTYLPDMEVHMDAKSGERRVFTSWRTAADPSPGNFSMGVDPRGSPQIVIWEGANRRWRSGHWNGISFIGVTEVRTIYLFGFRLTNLSDGRLYFTYTPSDSSFVKFQINWEGVERQETWNDERKEWRLVQAHDECDRYNRCGAFAKCDRTEGMRCRCLEGFVIKDEDQWSRGNWSGGCTRRTGLECREDKGLSVGDGGKDGFGQVENVKLPDFVDYVGKENMKECQRLCLHYCSCTAFAFVSGINCMIWTRDLVDVQQFVEGGNTLFVRLAASELDVKKVPSTLFLVLVVVSFVFISVGIYYSWKLIAKHKDKSLPHELSQVSLVELPLFTLEILRNATNNFSEAKKLGKGGFGPVYKGEMGDGREIAVKRLSQASTQGMNEFMNEVVLISKLQHKNLVRLLGCCVENKENMLVYEYMPNKSLDYHLFDSSQEIQDWRKRYNIIEGICRGLLYLHRDSRLKIIHRDLKPSNILLDNDWNPKISDFGMARIFGAKQDHVSTVRVVGTYGYMAPEYAIQGRFSEKSDVYSFGVLMVEIATGRRNKDSHEKGSLNLLGHVWNLWNEDNISTLIDTRISSLSYRAQVMRCIHIGLLCVQRFPGDRPSISAVLSMLRSEISQLPNPKLPAFAIKLSHSEAGTSYSHLSQTSSSSINNVTLTAVDGR